MLIGVRGVHLNVLDKGEGDAVLFLHGLGLDATLWKPQVAAFAAQHRCIAVDHRGHGKSDRTYAPFQIADLADDAAGVLDALGVDEVHVVGLSMGGSVAQELALRHPVRVRTLAILDSFAELSEESRGQIAQTGPLALTQGSAAMTPMFETIMFAPSTFTERPEVIEDFREVYGSTDPVCFARATGAIADVSTVDRLPQIRVPTVVLWGEHDNLTPRDRAEQIVQAIPDARFEVVPEAGHLSNQENPDVVNAALSTLWSKVPAVTQ